jgi:HlyD family secretion protein
MANKNLGRTTILAPMDGVITELNVEKGQKVVGTGQMAGTQMMIVADVRIMELQVLVGENDVVKVKTGDSADISVEAYNNRKFKGVVTRISSSNVSATGNANAATGANDVTNYKVYIRIDPSSYGDLVSSSRPTQTFFRPGMNASADIKTNRKDGVLAVPSGAVASRAKGSGESMEETKKKREKSNANGDESTVALSVEMEVIVFVLNADGTVSKRQVTTGIQNINYMEISSGLKEGEQVVTAPYTAVSKSLRDGRKVTVVPKEKLFDEK